MTTDELLKVLGANSDEHIMVNKAIFMGLITMIPLEILERFNKQIVLNAPEIGSDSFKTWAINTRASLGLTQEEVSSEAQIGQEDLSKYERGLLKFGDKRKSKLRTFFIQKLNERESKTA